MLQSWFEYGVLQCATFRMGLPAIRSVLAVKVFKGKLRFLRFAPVSAPRGADTADVDYGDQQQNETQIVAQRLTQAHACTAKALLAAVRCTAGSDSVGKSSL